MPPRIKILHIIDGFGGGAGEWVQEIIRLSNREKFEHLVCMLLPTPASVSIIDNLKQHGIKVVILINTTSPLKRRILKWNPIEHILNLNRLRRLIKEEKINLVHAHIFYSLVYGSLAGYLARIPVIFTVPLMKKQAPVWYIFPTYGVFQPFVSKYITAISIEELTRFALIPEKKIRWFKGGLDSSSIHITPAADNPVISEFDLKDAFPIILSIGRYDPEKGHEFACEAIKQLKDKYPKIRLIILGGGGEHQLEWMIDIVRRKQLKDHVIIPGFRKDVALFMSASHIYIRTSLFEGGNLSCLKAMAHRLPTVAFDTKAPTECIANNINGILIEPQNHEALVNAISLLIDSEALRTQLGEKAFDTIQKEWDMDCAIRFFEEIYTEVSI